MKLGPTKARPCGNQFEHEGVQTHMPKQMPHKLADLSSITIYNYEEIACESSRCGSQISLAIIS
jgi:hypothetical protein